MGITVYNEDYKDELEYDSGLDPQDYDNMEKFYEDLQEKVLEFFGYGDRKGAWQNFLDSSWEEKWHIKGVEGREDLAKEITRETGQTVIVNEVDTRRGVKKKWTSHTQGGGVKTVWRKNGVFTESPY